MAPLPLLLGNGHPAPATLLLHLLLLLGYCFPELFVYGTDAMHVREVLVGVHH